MRRASQPRPPRGVQPANRRPAAQPTPHASAAPPPPPPGPPPAPPPHTPATTVRRTILLAGAATAVAPPPANAVISLPDPAAPPSRLWRRHAASTVDAYEFSVPLRVVALRGAAPAEWGADFRIALGSRGSLSFEARPQFESIWKELHAPEKAASTGSAGRGVRGRVASAARADAVSLGDEWLAPAIRAGLLQPVPGAETARWWRSLSPRWHALLRRDPTTGAPSPSGAIYGAPFRWGATLIGVRTHTLARVRGARPVTDWGDLFQPALRGRVAFSDSAREALTVALGALGLGPNPSAAALRALPPGTLAGAVALLRDQALLFSGRDHVRALASGDALVAVGSSADIAPLALRSAAVDAVAPAGGTALWADVWAVPTFAGGGSTGPSPLLPAWMELPLTPSRAEPARGLRGGGASPLLLPPAAPPRGRGPPLASPTPLLLGADAMPPPDVLAASEFLLPPADDGVAVAFRKALGGVV